MTSEERKDNTYFDKKGKQILFGDLLKIYHFRTANKIYYMYHVVVMEETEPFPVMALQSYNRNKPHCRLYVLANNSKRIFFDAEIISETDFQTKRLKLKAIDCVP